MGWAGGLRVAFFGGVLCGSGASRLFLCRFLIPFCCIYKVTAVEAYGSAGGASLGCVRAVRPAARPFLFYYCYYCFFYARAVRPAAKRGLFILFCFVCSTLVYAWRIYTYTYLRVYLYITVCVAGGVAKLRARRAAGRQPELTTEQWVPVGVSRLRGDLHLTDGP